MALHDIRVAQELAAEKAAHEQQFQAQRQAAQEAEAARLAAEAEAAARPTFGGDARVVTLSEDRVAVLEGLGLIKVLYATKSGTTVTVYESAASGVGKPTVLFSYEEYATAEGAGNLWQDLPPSAALSPDGRTIAYTSVEGLKAYDRTSAKTTTLVKMSAPPPADDQRGVEGATWSGTSGPEVGAHVVAMPVWSADGSLIVIKFGFYEGSADAVVTFPQGELRYGENSPSIEARFWRPAQAAKPYDFYTGDRTWVLDDAAHPTPTMALSTIGLDDVLFEAKDGKLLVTTNAAETTFQASLPAGYSDWTDLRLIADGKLALSGQRYAEGNLTLQHYVIDLATGTIAAVGPETPAAARATVLGAVPELK